MIAAATSGVSRMYQGSVVLINSRSFRGGHGISILSVDHGTKRERSSGTCELLRFAPDDQIVARTSLLILQRTDVFHVGGLACAVESNDDGEADRDFGGGDGDDEKDEDLRVVSRQSSGADPRPGERNERE